MFNFGYPEGNGYGDQANNESTQFGGAYSSSSMRPQEIEDNNMNNNHVNEHRNYSDTDWMNNVLKYFKEEKPGSFDDWKKILKSSSDFIQAALLYGKVIISERNFPNEKRTIPCINENDESKGLAGGAKYIHEGIIFKFPSISKGSKWLARIFGNNKTAQKALANELLAAMSVMQVPNLIVPMMVIIDFMGYRLFASALIHEIAKNNGNTLVYGSESGNNYRNKTASDEHLSAIVESLSSNLNIREHSVMFDNNITATIVGAFDCEIHRVKNNDNIGDEYDDNNYYMIDTQRIFPSLPKLKDNHNIISDIFRPEFIKNYKEKLPTDVFSERQDPNTKNEDDEAVNQALIELQVNRIPRVAQQLNKKIENGLITKGSELVDYIHRKGINLLFLGHLLSRSPNSAHHHYRVLLYSEMFARVIKNRIKENFRKILNMKSSEFGTENDMKNVIVDILNKFIKSIEFRKSLENDLKNSFTSFAKDKEGSEPFDFHDQNDMFVNLVVHRIEELLNLEFSNSIPVSSFLPSNFHFVESDIKHIHPRVKYMNITARANGEIYALQALHGGPGASRLQETSEKFFEAALKATPDNTEILSSFAKRIIDYTLKICSSNSEIDLKELIRLLQKALLQLKRAKNLNELNHFRVVLSEVLSRYPSKRLLPLAHQCYKYVEKLLHRSDIGLDDQHSDNDSNSSDIISIVRIKTQWIIFFLIHHIRLCNDQKIYIEIDDIISSVLQSVKNHNFNVFLDDFKYDYNVMSSSERKDFEAKVNYAFKLLFAFKIMESNMKNRSCHSLCDYVYLLELVVFEGAPIIISPQNHSKTYLLTHSLLIFFLKHDRNRDLISTLNLSYLNTLNNDMNNNNNNNIVNNIEDYFPENPIQLKTLNLSNIPCLSLRSLLRYQFETSITSLDLSNSLNDQNNSPFETLIHTFLPSTPQLKHLNINNNDHVIRSLISNQNHQTKFFESLPNLESLSIALKQSYNYSNFYFNPLLTFPSTLRFLDLEKIELDRIELFDLLLHFKILESLNVRYTKILMNDRDWFAASNQNNLSTNITPFFNIRHLTISSLPSSYVSYFPLLESLIIDHDASNLDASSIKDIFQKQHLNKLHLHKCSVSELEDGIRSLTSIIDNGQYPSSITNLHLSDCCIAIGTLKNLLSYVKNLEYLSLQNCDIRNEGVKVICSILTEKQKIKHLNLSNNRGIRDTGIVFNAIGKLRNLVSVNVDGLQGDINEHLNWRYIDF